MLHWLKENDTISTTDNPSGFQSNILDTGNYILLNSSDDGSVRYYKSEVNRSDSGTYVAMATLDDYYEIISTVEITIGMLSSLQLLRNTCTYNNYIYKIGISWKSIPRFSSMGKFSDSWQCSKVDSLTWTNFEIVLDSKIERKILQLDICVLKLFHF